MNIICIITNQTGFLFLASVLHNEWDYFFGGVNFHDLLMNTAALFSHTFVSRNKCASLMSCSLCSHGFALVQTHVHSFVTQSHNGKGHVIDEVQMRSSPNQAG